MDPTTSTKGTYTILIELRRDAMILVGKKGKHRFRSGLYTYTGSAMGGGSTGLQGRIQRHFRKEKKKRWHIDYLLADDSTRVLGVVYNTDGKRRECSVARKLGENVSSLSTQNGFGSSDCRSGCITHLHYFPSLGEEELIFLVREAYETTAGGKLICLKTRNPRGEPFADVS